jgi:hypothetical protein
VTPAAIAAADERTAIPPPFRTSVNSPRSNMDDRKSTAVGRCEFFIKDALLISYHLPGTRCGVELLC